MSWETRLACCLLLLGTLASAQLLSSTGSLRRKRGLSKLSGALLERSKRQTVTSSNGYQYTEYSVSLRSG